MGAPSTVNKAIKDLGSQLLQSSHVNENIPILIETAQSGSVSAVREAIAALQAYFLSIARKGILVTEEKVESNENTEDAVSSSWLRSQYQNYLNSLLKIVSKEETTPAVKTFSFDCIMDYVREESPGRFANGPFFRLIQFLVSAEGDSSAVIDRLKNKYLEFSDIRCMLYSNLEKIIDRKLKSTERPILASVSSLPTFAASIFSIVDGAPLPPPLPAAIPTEGNQNQPVKKPTKRLAEKITGEVVLTLKYWSAVQTEEGDQEKAVKKRKKSSGKPFNVPASTAKFHPKNERKYMQQFWLKLLQLPLTQQTYKKVLTTLGSRLIPYMSNPLLLSDFLTDSYNQGGVVAVMALTGLLHLMTSHGLEYPSFYNKLYSLLDAQLFLARHRASFFQLLDMCLNSSHLPSYLAAAFAKKVSRLALIGPPSGALIAIALVHNLLRRHPSINVLVHRQIGTRDADEGDGAEGGEEKLSDLIGADPFDFLEADISKCRALESSLWEIETLRSHYCPAVSRFVGSLETDLTERSKTSEVNISDFSSGSFSTILAEEGGKRLKQVPLAFYKSTPKGLFSDIDGDKDFFGWNFENKI